MISPNRFIIQLFGGYYCTPLKRTVRGRKILRGETPTQIAYIYQLFGEEGELIDGYCVVVPDDKEEPELVDIALSELTSSTWITIPYRKLALPLSGTCGRVNTRYCRTTALGQVVKGNATIDIFTD